LHEYNKHSIKLLCTEFGSRVKPLVETTVCYDYKECLHSALDIVLCSKLLTDNSLRYHSFSRSTWMNQYQKMLIHI